MTQRDSLVCFAASPPRAATRASKANSRASLSQWRASAHPRQAINDVVVQWVTTKLQKRRAGGCGVHGPRDNAQPNRHGAGATRRIKDRCSLTSWVAWPRSICSGAGLSRADDTTTSGGYGSSFRQDFRILTHVCESPENPAPPWTPPRPRQMIRATPDCRRAHGHCGLAPEPGPREV